MASGLTDKRRLYCKHVNELHKIIEKDLKKYEAFLKENLQEPRPGVVLCTHGDHFGGLVSKFKSVIEIMNFQVLNHVSDEHLRVQSGRQATADSGIGSDVQGFADFKYLFRDKIMFYKGGGVSPTLQPPTWRPRVSLCSLPFDISGLGDPAGSYATADKALRVIEKIKHPHHDKVEIPICYGSIYFRFNLY